MSKIISNMYVRGALIVVLATLSAGDIGSYGWWGFIVVMNFLVNFKGGDNG